MTIANLCPPAFIYLIFSITHIAIDSFQGMYNTALMKLWVSFIFTILLNYLCELGLGILSWIIVFIPFILMTMIVGILLIVFGLDPRSGKLTALDSKGNVIDKKENSNYKSDDESNFIGLYGLDKTGKNKKEKYNVTALDYDAESEIKNTSLFKKFAVTDVTYRYR
tara:strand:+ start:1021 stop:1518 length:498 start_codon:yes stop_codon:yes gene_type:complete